MANLIITESQIAAMQIAASLGGIRTKGGNVKYDRLKDNLNKLSQTTGERPAYYETVLNKEKTFVIWTGKNPVEEKKLKASPRVFYYKIYQITEEIRKTINNKRLKEAQNGKWEAVYFAMTGTVENCIARDVLMKSLPAREYYDAIIAEYEPEKIKSAFRNPFVCGTRINIEEAVQRNVNRTNTENIISERLKDGTRLDHYELAALTLLKRQKVRVNAKNNTQNFIKATAQMHGVKCGMKGNMIHTKQEAEKLLKEFPQTVVLDPDYESGYIEGLAVSTDIFGSDGIADIYDLKHICIDMYDKGFITNPISLSKYIPKSFMTEEQDRLLASCVQWTGEEYLSDDTIQKALKKVKRTGTLITAIMPCPISEKTTFQMTEKEQKLYDGIVRRTLKLIEENSVESFRFLAGNYPLYTALNIEEIKNSLRLEEHIGAAFSASEMPKKKPITDYTVKQLFEEMRTLGIGSADIYFDIYDSIRKKGFADVNEQGEISLTDKGEEVFRQVPAGKGFLDLCANWEKAFKTQLSADWPAAAMKELEQDLDESAALWNKGKRPQSAPAAKDADKTKQSKPQETKKPAEEQKAEETKVPERTQENTPAQEKDPSIKVMLCPSCGRETLSENEAGFACSSCGFEIKKDLEIQGLRTVITEKDIERLAKAGRTAAKVFHDGSDGVKGYLIMNEGALDVTNESQIKCPVCGAHLFLYDWGFGCESCKLDLPFEIRGARIDMKEYQKLFMGKETSYIEKLGGKLAVEGGKIVLKRD